ncbi:MAG: M14 family zinc carboxypeptidase [Bacteroidota bacterium]|nr:M14 family zinc carboxypeptidase [Bacteroidota bacterium]
MKPNLSRIIKPKKEKWPTGEWNLLNYNDQPAGFINQPQKNNVYMKWMITLLPLIARTLLFAGTGYHPAVPDTRNTIPVSDTGKNEITLASYRTADSVSGWQTYSLKEISFITKANKITQFSLGSSQQGRKIGAFYFPGTSKQRALVIAGVHGSELSSVEVAWQLIRQLMQDDPPYYSVIIIPSLFPDNSIKAMNDPALIGGVANIGRYTFPFSVDPNRQMPSPGEAYDENNGTDHLGRFIEKENQLLLQLIQSFRPQRIVNLHAIRNKDYGGVYADPRTDQNGIALGFSSDSSLAIRIAACIHQHGGNVEGNNLDREPTALYYKDPIPAPAGFLQKRNMTGSALNANRGSGVSLGTWGATAVGNKKDPSKNRDAMRIITIEYPGYKRPGDYTAVSQQLFQQRQVELFASAIRTIFLGPYFTENENNELAKK